MTSKLKIDVWTDTICPWCLVGVARLDQAVAALPDGVEVDIENHPFYLDPDLPPEGEDVRERLERKYGRPPDEMWARVESEARKSGIDLEMAKQPRSYPTQKGHTLIRLARAKGTQHDLAKAIAWAHFMEHRQINDEEVLADIAAQHGYARDEALQVLGDADAVGETHDLAVAALHQGIQGVPFFVFDQRFAVSGAQPAEVFARALRVALGEEELPAS